jgi:hypothetical protein
LKYGISSNSFTIKFTGISFYKQRIDLLLYINVSIFVLPVAMASLMAAAIVVAL